MSIDPITVNDNQMCWGSIQLEVADDILYGFCGIKYSQKRERSKAYGAGTAHAPRGRTAGKYSAEAAITVWKSSAEAIRQKLAALDPKGSGSYGNTEFQVVCSFEEESEGLIQVVMYRCVVASTDANHEENPDPLKEDWPLDVMAISENGVTLLDNSDGGIQVAGGAGGVSIGFGVSI